MTGSTNGTPVDAVAAGGPAPAAAAALATAAAVPARPRVEPKDVFGRSIRHFLEPIVPLLDDPTVSEILINGPDQVYFERAGILQPSDIRFADGALVLAAARNIADYVGRSIGDDRHSLDARLPDGSRVHVIVPPCSRQGVCVSIRKFRRAAFDLDKLVERGTLTAAAAEFLRLAVLLHRNTVISGGTGSVAPQRALGRDPGTGADRRHRGHGRTAARPAAHRVPGGAACRCPGPWRRQCPRPVRGFAAHASRQGRRR
jgi:hypothetical protein